MDKKRAVIVEDNPLVASAIQDCLSRHGWNCHICSDGEQGLQQVRSQMPNIVLLELALPEIDGFEVCRRLRADTRTQAIPIIMLTSRGGAQDIVRGLDIGADDYIIKPFEPAELVARVRALMRRAFARRHLPSESSGDIHLEGVSIDRKQYEVTVSGRIKKFSPTEFRLLYFLASNPNRVFTRNQLVNEVMGPDVVITHRTIDVHIRSVRSKLGKHRNLIETVRGVGYRLRVRGAR